MPAAARRNLTIAAAAAATAVAAVYDLWLWLTNYAADNFHNDFTFYYAAARLGLQHGWARLYDLGLQQQQLDAIESHITVAQLARYVSPPPLACSCNSAQSRRLSLVAVYRRRPVGLDGGTIVAQLTADPAALG